MSQDDEDPTPQSPVNLAVFKKPGCEWTDQEYEHFVRSWVWGEKYYESLLVVRHMLSGWQEADVQEAWGRFYGKLPEIILGYRTPANFPGYYMTCLRGTVADFRRSVQRNSEREVSLEDIDLQETFAEPLYSSPGVSPENHAESRDTLKHVMGLLRQLEPRKAGAILSAAKGTPLSEIASQLGVPKNTIKTWIHRFRSRATQRLDLLAEKTGRFK